MRGRNSAVVVLLALTLAGCGGGTTQTVAPAHSGDFTVHAKAVQPVSEDRTGSAYTGIEHLVPLGSCAIAFGLVDGGNGKVAANWTGNGDCTSFTRSNRAGLAATAAVALADGSVVGTNVMLQHLTPDGAVAPLADLRQQVPDPQRETRAYSIVRSGDRLVIGGGQTDADNKSIPLVWTSGDGGKTVTAVPVPAVNGIIGPMVADGNTIVAVEQIAEENQLGVWRSTDGGRTWQLAELATEAQPIVTTVLRTKQGWLIVGYGEKDAPFVASSSDGAAWQVVDTSKAGEGRVVDAAVTKAGELVIIGEGQTGNSSAGCSVAWTGAPDSLRRVDLGCDDVAKAATTLADGRVIVVGVSTVWEMS